MSHQLPHECSNTDCGYQYCGKCVQSIKQCNGNRNAAFYCMYCNNSSPEGPRQNKFLIDLLWEHFQRKYNVDLSSPSDIMPGALSKNIECRLFHVEHLVQTLKKKKNNITSIPGPIKSAIDNGVTLINNLKEIKSTCIQFKPGVTDDTEIDTCLKNYLNHLNGTGNTSRKYENFIKICETLQYYIEQAKFQQYSPLLYQIMINWENSLMTNDKFLPKVIDFLKASESDLSRFILPSLPPRIGFIGEESSGKTSIMNLLRDIAIEDANNLHTMSATSEAKLASPIRVGKSTLCQLEFEHEYVNKKKVIFVDIEGATDSDSDLSSGNYLDEIKKANCDLYIIVFNNKFQKLYKEWQDYIEKVLHRQCWFVRNKIDELFIPTFEEDVGQSFNSCNKLNQIKYGEKIIAKIRESVSYDTKNNKLSNLYLTCASYYKNSLNEILLETSIGKFDFEKLKNDIQNLPSDFHSASSLNMSIQATAKVINTCFRRGYVVNVLKYKIYAGVAAVVPFADLIPRYFGREEIRQAFGVNSRSRFMNWWTNQTDEFKDYLKKFNIETDESGFKTSALKQTVQSRGPSAASNVTAITSAVFKGATTLGVTGVSVSDDILRFAGVGAINAVRGASVALIVGGAILTAGMCAWSAVANGRQMYNYLKSIM